MNIGEYVRESMSVAAYDELIDRLAMAVAQEPPEQEDLGNEVLSQIEGRLQREAERVHRSIRAQLLQLNPYLRLKTREAGRHRAYCKLRGHDGYAVFERLPVDDGTERGCWRERPITRVFWHAPEWRWRCGCREFVRGESCEHVAALAIYTSATSACRRDVHTQPDDRLCGCGSPEFVCGLCYLCHLLAEQRWLEQWPARTMPPRAAVRTVRRMNPSRSDRRRLDDASAGNPASHGAA